MARKSKWPPACGERFVCRVKHKYPTLEEAIQGAGEKSLVYKSVVRPYNCMWCGYYHLTSRPIYPLMVMPDKPQP